MQLTNLATLLALAMTATALPAAENVDLLVPRTNNPQPTCQNGNQQPVCCNGLLGLLGCAVNVLGGACSGSSYCCSTTAAPVSFSGSRFGTGWANDCVQGTLLNIQLLNCLHL